MICPKVFKTLTSFLVVFMPTPIRVKIWTLKQEMSSFVDPVQSLLTHQYDCLTTNVCISITHGSPHWFEKLVI